MADTRRVASFVVATALLLGGCGGTAHHRGATSRPPPNESPRKIVAAYFAALHAHDPAAARPLLTPAWFKVVTGPGSWLEGGANIKLLRVSRGFDYGPIDGYRHSWWVGATFMLSKQRTPGPMLNGVNSYGYILVRNSPSEGWRIGDEGLG